VCGIAGVVARRGTQARREAAEAMALRLQHRGPDACTSWVAPSGLCALGHSRLSVIDLALGDQPMSTPDGRWSVVFNGEIYNFRALRDELAEEGVRFQTDSDTEVLLQGWARWEHDLLPRLEGMFAFGVWDEERDRLTLVRDRAGKKPVHLYDDGQTLAFASEIGAFRALQVDLVPDPREVERYLAYGYVPAPETLYRHVRVLPPGSLVEWTADGVGAPRRWWRLRPKPVPTSPTAAARRVRTLLTEAVERRLISDVPLGAFLSGGVDPTAVVALMQRASGGDPVRTFSIGFDDPVYDEGPWAQRAADALGTRHTHHTVTAPDPEWIPELMKGWDVPFADSSAIPTWIVSKLAREEVTVALTGDGGDELFAGYWRLHAVGMATAIPDPLKPLLTGLSKLIPSGGDFRGARRRARRFLDSAALTPEARLLNWVGAFGAEASALLRPEFRRRVAASDSGSTWLLESLSEVWRVDPSAVPLTRALRTNFETYLPEDLLVKADRASMAHGLELRSPFLDTALVECAATLPPGIQRRGGTLKAVLKDAVADLVPVEILNRPKQGFGVPLPVWFRGPWRSFLEEHLRDRGARIYDWLDPDAVEDVLRDHLERGIDREHRLWALLTLELWLRGQG